MQKAISLYQRHSSTGQKVGCSSSQIINSVEDSTRIMSASRDFRNKVTDVVFGSDMPFSTDFIELLGEKLKNLQKLTFMPRRIVDQSAHDTTIEDFETLTALSPFAKALSKVPHLTELDIRDGNVEVNASHFFLRLPKLKKLKLAMPRNWDASDVITGLNRNPMKRNSDNIALAKHSMHLWLNMSDLTEKVTDSMRDIQEPCLEELDLSGCNFSSLSHTLSNLYVFGKNYKDCLSTFSDLRNLKMLNLSNTGIPDQFVTDLQALCPNLTIKC